MRQRDMEAAARKDVVRDLLEAGLAVQETAGLLGIKESQVAAIQRAIPEDEAQEKPHASSREAKDQAFRNAFRLAVVYGAFHTEPQGDMHHIYFHRALGSYLGRDRFHGIVEGVAGMLAQLIFPQDEPMLAGCRDLLIAIGGDPPQISGDDVLSTYLRSLAHVEADDLPTRDTMGEMFTAWAFAKYEPHFRVPLRMSGLRAVESALEVLAPEETTIIRLIYGLGCAEPAVPLGTRYTREQCKGIVNGGSAVSRLERTALRKLRDQQEQLAGLWQLLNPPVAGVLLQLEAMFPEPQPE